MESYWRSYLVDFSYYSFIVILIASSTTIFFHLSKQKLYSLNTVSLFLSLSLLHPNPWQYLSSLFLSQFVPHTSGFTLYWSFCDWFISLSMISSRFIHVVTCVIFSFLFKAESWVGNGTPLQYSCLENSLDIRAQWTTVLGATKSQTWMSNWAQSWIISCECVYIYVCVCECVCVCVCVYTCHIFYPLVLWRTLDWFHFFTTVNNAALNMIA